jgi:hypothetical protein
MEDVLTMMMNTKGTRQVIGILGMTMIDIASRDEPDVAAVEDNTRAALIESGAPPESATAIIGVALWVWDHFGFIVAMQMLGEEGVEAIGSSIIAESIKLDRVKDN